MRTAFRRCSRQGQSSWRSSGPLVGGGAPWTINGLDGDTIEIVSPPGWIQATQLAHLVRDRAGKVTALVVSTGRIKKMRFERTG